MKTIIRSTCRKEIFLTILFFGLATGLYIYLYQKGVSKILENNSIIIGIFISILFSYLVIKCLIKKYWKYVIIEDNNKIIQKTFLLKNDVIISVSNHIIINTNQSFLQMLLKIIDIKIEADGDPTVPEIYIKDVPDKYYDTIKRLKFYN